MVEALGRTLDGAFRRYMPDPFVLAVLLSALVIAMAVGFGDAFDPTLSALGRLHATVLAWGQYLFEPRRADGTVVKGYLYFAFQMCVMLVTGHALATSKPVKRIVSTLASVPRTARQAVALVAAVATAAALTHWALGLVVGALVAREVGRQASARGVAVHYPLLGAAGYSGLMVWGGGLSGSIPLKAAEYTGTTASGAPVSIPLEATLFSELNLVVCAVALVGVPLVAAMLHPREGASIQPFRGDEGGGSSAPEEAVGPTGDARQSSFVRWLETSPIPALAVAALGLWGPVSAMASGTFALTFNQLNLLFLFVGLALQGSLVGYTRAIGTGAAGCAGVLLQFPIYFGLLGTLVVSGLASQAAQAMVAWSTETTYPWLVFLSAGLVNFVVPSGGGQWIVQGDIVINGAAALHADLGRSVLALAYGDGWTNMLQPFWALPLLAITGLAAREIVGYTAALMILAGAWISALLIFW